MKIAKKWFSRWGRIDKQSKKMLADEFVSVMNEENVTLASLDEDLDRFYTESFCKDPLIRKDLYRRIIRLLKAVTK